MLMDLNPSQNNCILKVCKVQIKFKYFFKVYGLGPVVMRRDTIKRSLVHILVRILVPQLRVPYTYFTSSNHLLANSRFFHSRQSHSTRTLLTDSSSTWEIRQVRLMWQKWQNISLQNWRKFKIANKYFAKTRKLLTKRLTGSHWHTISSGNGQWILQFG